MNKITRKINWQKNSGLVPIVIQDIDTNRVLMLGYMNQVALEKTLKTKKVWFFSRSKNRLWMKGEESKNYLYLKDIKLDCDHDTLLIKVQPVGPTCHLNLESCFDSPQPISCKQTADIGFLAELYNLLEKRKKEMPKDSYTAKLFKAGVDKIGAKIMEEAAEVYQAASKETKHRLIYESFDLIYHLLVMLAYKDIKLSEILKEGEKRK